MVEIALVGPPSHGKSTIFKAATMKDVAIADYPFTTIEPNEGMAFYRTECPEKFIGRKCSSELCIDGKRFVPFKLWDVAGLVEGAHEGKGRGLEFLNDIARANLLVVVVDASGKTGIDGVGEGDPVKIVRAIERELDYWYLSVIERERRIDEESLVKRLSGMKVPREAVAKALENYDGDLLELASTIRKLSKPVVIAANKADREGSWENIERLRDYFSHPIVLLSAYYELALREASRKGLIRYVPGDESFEIINANEDQRKALEKIAEFMERNHGTGLQKLINVAVEEAGYIVVYPVEDEEKWTDSKGNILPEAMLVKKGTTAKEFAYLIHEDIGKGFVAAIDAKTRRRIAGDSELENGQVVSIKHK